MTEDKVPALPKQASRLLLGCDNEIVQRFVRMNLEEEVIGGDADKPVHAPHVTLKIEAAPTETKAEPNDVGSAEPRENVDEHVEGTPKRKLSVLSISSQELRRRNLTKQITQELKKKRKKRRMRNRRHEELYTDKDRAAAVNMGSKDIKQSLKAKRKQDRSKVLSIPEEAEPGNFLALGNHEARSGNEKLAISFYNKALELNPQEKNALVARSQCYILMGQPDLALKDAEAALSVDKNFMKAIFQKAESLYYLGEFEHSLVYYHRGSRIRPDLEGFKLGVHKAQKAIENALATSMISKPNTPDSKSAKSTGSKRSKSSTRLTQMPKQLCVEMKYLDGLLKHPDIKCKLTEDSDIASKVKEAVDYLNTRQEFWRQQLPPKHR